MKSIVPRNANVVLLPTFNEAKNLPLIVPKILEAIPTDLWVIDDNSPDGTGALADTLASKYPALQVIHRRNKEGLGKAYIDGFQKALTTHYTRVFQMDADFSHNPECLATMLQESKSYDLVLGSRWISGGGTEGWPWYRQVISRGGSLYARTLLNCSIRDLTSGFKCWHRDTLQALPLHCIESTGYAFQIEMTYRALRAGFRVHEMPIVFVEREIGTSKMSRQIVLEAIINVPRLRWRLRSGIGS